MNLAERGEDVDYEPDVMKLKQIWHQMKQTNNEDKRQSNKIPSHDHSNSKAKTKKPRGDSKKQTVVSKKKIQRNPKPDSSNVIQVVTNPQGFYTDNIHNQRNGQNPQVLLQTATNSNPVGEINQLKKRISEKDYELSLLRVSNTRNQDKVLALENELQRKEQRILQFQNRQRALLNQISQMGDREVVFDYGKVEYENFKNDTRRLLKMLQTTNEYQQFANLGLDDDGVRFLNTVNKKIKTHIDTSKRQILHFCTCNKEFIPQSGFWVPEKVYSFGKQFVKNKKGEMTQPQLELLLYELNRIWRQREKRIVNTLNSQKAKEVQKLKRKIANISHDSKK